MNNDIMGARLPLEGEKISYKENHVAWPIGATLGRPRHWKEVWNCPITRMQLVSVYTSECMQDLVMCPY